MKCKVFNVEFDGIDKSGKDSIMRQIFSVAPNKYIAKARGLISQVAYSNLFRRGMQYDATRGYMDNTLFVLLEVDKDDWDIRCDLTNEHALNRMRSDVEGAVEWKSHSEAFRDAFEQLKQSYGDSSHFMRFNTSHQTPVSIIKAVVAHLEQLNTEE